MMAKLVGICTVLMFKHVHEKNEVASEELHIQGSPTQYLSTKIILALLGVVLS